MALADNVQKNNGHDIVYKRVTKGAGSLILLLKLVFFIKKQDTICISNKYGFSCVAS